MSVCDYGNFQLLLLVLLFFFFKENYILKAVFADWPEHAAPAGADNRRKAGTKEMRTSGPLTRQFRMCRKTVKRRRGSRREQGGCKAPPLPPPPSPPPAPLFNLFWIGAHARTIRCD